MIKHIIFFLFLCLIVCWTKKVIKIDKTEVCGRDSKCPIKTKTLIIRYRRGSGFFLDWEIDLSRDLKMEHFRTKKVVKIDKTEVCGKGPKCPIKIKTLIIRFRRGSGFFLDTEADLYRDIKMEHFRVLLNIQRCANREALDTCERFGLFDPPAICNLINMEHVGWDEARDSFEPPMRCPFKKGHYVGRNITINPNLFSLFPMVGYYWRMNASIFEGKDYLASMCFDWTIMEVI